MKLRLFLKIYLGLHLLFAAVYGSANWLASMHAQPAHYFAPWEPAMPFVPLMIYAYFSIALLFWVPLFVLDETRMRRLGVAAAACILIAGLCFVLAPGILGYPALPALGGTIEETLLQTLQSVDKRFNTAPSLHVALSTLLVLVARHGSAPVWLRAMLFAWLGTIMVSVLLVHQHHLFDVASGALLGALCYAWYRRPFQAV
jgi:membrane-associated phospholipid phosphatase